MGAGFFSFSLLHYSAHRGKMSTATEHGGNTMNAINQTAQFFYGYYYFFAEKR